MPKLIEKDGKIEIWEMPSTEAEGEMDYFVYGIYENGDPRVCPSIGMAHEVAFG